MASNIVMTRVDARLVHGQVATRWTKVTNAKAIAVVDDKTAMDEFLTEILYMASPVGVKVTVYTEEQAVEIWKGDGFGEQNTILLFQNVDTAKRCFDAGINYESINIGQVPKAPGRRRANNTVQLSDDELEELIDLDKHGVRVYFHPTPEDLLTTLDTVVKRLKG